MIDGLIGLANHLDINGYEKEVAFLDKIISLASKNPDLLSNPNDIKYHEPKSINVEASKYILNNILKEIRTLQTRRSDGDDGIDPGDETYHLGGFGTVSDAQEALDRYNHQYPEDQMGMQYESLDGGKTKITWV